MDLKNVNENDPLKRMVEKQTEREEFSPMDPPDAYSPPSGETVSYEEMHPFLQQLTNEHKVGIEELNAFEEALLHIQEKGSDEEVDLKLRRFFQFFDDAIVKHNQREDRFLFPLLHQRMVENGEHSKGPEALTAVDMLEDEHVKILQLTTVAFHLFRLVMRLPDPESRLILLSTALEHSKQVVDILRLHIFREDNVVFAQAHRLISKEEFDEMEARMSANRR